MSPPDPENVFTPKAVVTPELFARRNEPDILGNPGVQDSLVDGLREKGAQLRVFGDTGVGKTSLVAFAAQEAQLERLVVECMSGYDYADLIHTAITKIQGVKLRTFTKTVASGASLDASGGFHFLASLKGSLKRSGGEERDFEIVDAPPIDLLIALMQEAGYQLLVFDNFQNITSEDTRRLVAQTMEVLSDRASDGVEIKLAVIGIAQDAQTLIGHSGSFRRRTTDIGVPRMPDDEIRLILRTGFGLLGLDAADYLVDHLVYFSDGFPFFAHLLGLNIARTARRERTQVVDQSVIALAMNRCVAEVDESYAARVRLAEETGGTIQPRRRILQLLASSDERAWTSNAVTELWIDVSPLAGQGSEASREGLGFINVALGSLIKPENGSILSRDESQRPYVYRFSDPHFRAYLRIRGATPPYSG